MKQLQHVLFVFVVTFPGLTYAVGKGPLLISELPPNQVYTEQQLTDFEKHPGTEFKGRELSGLEKDYQLYQKALGIAPENLTHEQRDFLRNLTAHKPRAYKAHAEGPVAIPVYNIKALAEHKLFKYKVAVEASKMETLFSSNIQQFVQQSTLNSTQVAAARKVIQDALSIAEVTQMQLIDAYKVDNSNYSVVMLSELAEVTGNKDAVLAVLKKDTSDWQKNQLLNGLNQYFSAQEQQVLLQEIIEQKNKLSSQALLIYAKLPATVLDESFLYELLSDEVLGASSAAAISNLPGLDFNWLVDNIKNHSKSRTAVANSLLVLRLSSNPEAKRVLHDIVAADYIQFADIKAEVATWIE